MQRNLEALAQNVFDVLIIGGGIYGACAAWEAAQRGLSVALVEKEDFGGATSSNSLKIIHGGLRYLQHADFKRMRESIHERMVLMRIAPHLVHPLPCVMPTYGHALKGKEVMAVAMLLNDLIGFDRNGLEDPQKFLPHGRVISKEDCRRLIPGVDENGLTGGAVWYDCHVYNSERLLLSFLHSAVQAGAQIANYVAVAGFLREGNRITGVSVEDKIGKNRFDIRAKLTINNSGPWVNQVLGLMNGKAPAQKVLLSKAMNLVIRRQLIPEYAVGVPSKFEFKDADAIINKGSRLLFIRPWRHLSLIGTTHVAYEGNPQDFCITEQEIQEFVDEVSTAYPAAHLTRDDVSFHYGGLLPMEGVNPRSGDVKLLKQYILKDHAADDGLEGLVTVVSVKYTTARDVAEKSIDFALQKLNRSPRESRSQETPIYGGDIKRFDEFVLTESRKQPHGLSPELVKHLIENYGSAYTELFKHISANPALAARLSSDTNVIAAEVVHGIRAEMAQKLVDVVMRRTELGTAGNPGEPALQRCADLMAAELGWSDQKKKEEIAEMKRVFAVAQKPPEN
ncbi:glycerol-3-phosphate dehydrogenase/oxidase [bacterium]|nr:glycerol-3-phosphate dehydrogenase/oxidase [bacterium]RIK76023.1 MAG: glycerol-3-phosphate dehydrogenase/oxidase [candidate division KSB1 bacterium]